MRRLALMVVATILTVVWALPAYADVVADEATYTVAVAADGTLAVTQTLTFPAAPGEIVQVLPTSAEVDSDGTRRFVITDVAVEPDAATVATSDVPGGIEVRIASDTADPLTLSYTVAGATSAGRDASGDLTVVAWPVLSGLSVGVGSVTGTVTGPAVAQLIDCQSGPVGSVGKCALTSTGTVDSADATFQDGARVAGEQVVLTVGYPATHVAVTEDLVHRWSLDRAFTPGLPQTLAALAVALVGGAALWLLHRRTGVDEADGASSAVALFTPVGDGEAVLRPVEGVRPGHVGTLADETVDPVDITATLIDLAVRGHLRIVELPRTAHGATDWRLERRAGEDETAAFETRLLEAVAPVGGSALVSKLPAAVSGALPEVRDALYDDVVRRGWFASRPDSTRSTWRRIGVAALAVAVLAAALLIAFTSLGLLALVLLGLGAATLWLADQMPRRTAKGTAALSGLRTLAGQMATVPTRQLPRGRELEEASRVLGYAVVLGGTGRWLAALVEFDADQTPDPTALDWYHAPDTWHLRDLPSSLAQFITTVQGLLISR
ncbi:DUF2207 family protein [Tessaracoccus palaemonis]|uniref:DUF2207 domain-containing protein n=1 Tax=Tessaracoccus palaemonis TaxID=2829499 RepID=A0ABX8SMR2_9ACTN|nr:DUF2207 domain-containing protein [Tessaracoccus palaemonis]QXT63343.1 DUF2207 domain-containing protein [Tessaracoccus palaemonis]